MGKAVVGAVPYFPLERDVHAMTMNARALAADCLIEVDLVRYQPELALKETILASNQHYYYRGGAPTLALQWETLELLLPNLARHYPQCFRLERAGARWTWHNALLGTVTSFTLGDAATLPAEPLWWLGGQVQEDLILLDGAAGTPLVAGHLCFAAGWCLDDKLGQSFLAIHGPVPGFAEQIGRSSNLLMQRLKPDHPVGRVNWSLTTDDELDHAPRVRHRWQNHRGIAPDNAGDRCFLRLERQTLSRLPHTSAILFTIHTYIIPIAIVAADPDRARRLAGNLRTMPPALQHYKGLDRYANLLLVYLDRAAHE
jgi:dimethylamine monooxygenase subunit A